MNWRRITGILLAVFMVLAKAMPAMCGACPKVTAVNACAEKHAAVAAQDDAAGPQTAMAAKCETCAGHAQLVSGTTAVKYDALAQSRGALLHCLDLITRNLLPATQYVNGQREPSRLAVTAAAHRDAANIHSAQHPTSAFRNSSTVNSPLHSLTAVLKI
jgi:hypothetical protein